ncbi:MAG: tRNA (adenosine(37)-N6)-threonylcarbamoyltransferase complex transferase subunit TsaD, partial [Thermoproteota archaeon]|nr:tRNA (adenosine(37)-N6)-threonylcarbamoyltransferase complex transferase subunit TsaD [Thermoproteota archaeon]
MLCLGIESTAHTFACSVIKHSDSKFHPNILSDVRDTFKAPEGSGIHPREAARHHASVAIDVLKKSLELSKINYKDLDLVAYSAGPGLGPCLRIGAVIARSISSFYDIKLIPINHALGHIELGMSLTNSKDSLVLLVSGGHTMILVFNNNRWRVIGETLDITLGQLLDQFGRHLGLASPCGAEIERLAHKSSKNYVVLPYSIKGNDVTFSGILSAAKRLISSSKFTVEDICYSIQETAFAMITEAVERALSATEKKELLLVGGVSANEQLSHMLNLACKRHKVKFNSCPVSFAGDNGAQIAWTGILSYLKSKNSINISDSFI